MVGFPYSKGRTPLIIIDPDTKEEKILLYYTNKPLSKKELENEISRGFLTREILIDLIHRGEKKVKNFLEPYIERASERDTIMTPFGRQYGNRHFLKRRFSHIIDTLNKKGYSDLTAKLSPLIESYNKSAATPIKEAHVIPSIENLYETSTSFDDFEKRINNLIDIYEKILDITKRFNEEYKNKVLKETNLNKLKEEDAVNITVEIVTKADRESNAELKKLLK